jgi:hypothetical protein
MSERDPILEVLRDEGAFASDTRRIARAAGAALGIGPRRRFRRFAAYGVAAAATLLLGWRAWQIFAAPSAADEGAGAPRHDARRFDVLPAEIAALSPRGESAADIDFRAATHEIFVLSPDREPLIVLIQRADARGD